MLILTRNPGQLLMIGDDITVRVISVNGNQVRLGIEAPADVDVHREEVYLRIQRQNAADDAHRNLYQDALRKVQQQDSPEVIHA